VGLLGRGLGLMAKRPRLFLVGALPALITSTLFLGILIALISQLDVIVGALTPFASGWNETLAAAVRVLIGAALLAAVGLLMVITFTTLTLTLGSPLYDKISESVEAEVTGRPAATPDEALVKGLGRALRQSLALIAVSVVVAPVLFLAGFIPVVGQILVPVVSAIFGGWMLGIELVGATFERSGLITLRDRRTAMARQRPRVLGLCIPVFLLLAIPFVAVVVFPVATAAGTMLALELLDPDRSPGGVADRDRPI
jgi:CysZ protein